MADKTVPEYADFRSKLKPSANSAILQDPTKYTTHDLNKKGDEKAPILEPVKPAAAAKAPPAKAAAPPPPSGGAPPPPPPKGPPPPPPPAPAAAGGGGGGDDAAAALFASINTAGSEGLRAGLKKATRGPVNQEAPVAAAPKPKEKAAAAPAAAADKPPKCALVGKKWEIEYQSDNHEIQIDVTDIKQTIYIFKCNKVTIQIKGKCNSISIDSCNKTAVVFEDALSQCEIVNSKDIQVQSTGKSPSINMDNCTAVTFYITEESVKDVHIVTAKCAAINIIRPKPSDPNDIMETPIPEQFLTTWKNDQWVTEFVSHAD
eukprot:CAMPEP_0184692218 /NCGR_PEP_ID=MMETSP0313-20130426/787_1 /TAXON_ID=2792 /ORGANISM="Porphyridium aerugineum, Strain SAG 1380-2" /LENGTH=316 /DNA_ID=CAMNT_0027150031 /DNA_START=99 /DNA_END=1049 /DNA_ORIENTATION=+